MRVRSQKKKYKCQLCAYSNISKSKLQYHVRDRHMTGPVCGTRASRRAQKEQRARDTVACACPYRRRGTSARCAPTPTTTSSTYQNTSGPSTSRCGGRGAACSRRRAAWSRHTGPCRRQRCRDGRLATGSARLSYSLSVLHRGRLLLACLDRCVICDQPRANSKFLVQLVTTPLLFQFSVTCAYGGNQSTGGQGPVTLFRNIDCRRDQWRATPPVRARLCVRWPPCSRALPQARTSYST